MAAVLCSAAAVGVQGQTGAPLRHQNRAAPARCCAARHAPPAAVGGGGVTACLGNDGSGSVAARRGGVCKTTVPRGGGDNLQGARARSQGRSSSSNTRVAATPSWHPDADHATDDPDVPTPGFASIEDALAEVAAGKFVVVLDDEDRENEGDLIGAGQPLQHTEFVFSASLS